MRLLRVGPWGLERPATLLPDGRCVDLTDLVGDVNPALLAGGLPDLRRAVDQAAAKLPVINLDQERIGAPLADSGKIVCVGLNYRAHAAEAGQPVPAEPILFLKSPDTIVGPNDAVLMPPSSTRTDYEVELAVVIGATARYVSDPAAARRHVAGYTISNDVSEREYQLERGGQWDKGKNCETFNPLGPWLVTADEVADPQNLVLSSMVNGQVRQASNTGDMIFEVAHLVWYISQFMVLYPGDIINTGTPEGVGSGFQPPRFLSPGDVVELAIEGLGTQRQSVRRASVLTGAAA